MSFVSSRHLHPGWHTWGLCLKVVLHSVTVGGAKSHKIRLCAWCCCGVVCFCRGTVLLRFLLVIQRHLTPSCLCLSVVWVVFVLAARHLYGFIRRQRPTQLHLLLLQTYRRYHSHCVCVCVCVCTWWLLKRNSVLSHPGWRRAQRFLSEPDLLISGHMFGLSCVKENYSEVNASKISHTSRLLAHTHGLNQVLSGLQLQISLLQWVPSWLSVSVYVQTDERSDCLSSVHAALHHTPTCSCGGCHGDERRGRGWRPAREETLPSVTSAASTATRSPEHLGKSPRREKRRCSRLQWRRSRMLSRRWNQGADQSSPHYIQCVTLLLSPSLFFPLLKRIGTFGVRINVKSSDGH